jgi:NAD(P)-dependent dehydrogenase (short-subunit alcohol dehydrogenase family)
VSPGPVETDLWLGEHGVAETVAKATGTDAATAREQIVAGMGGIPSGRFTKPEEVATLVCLLASPPLRQRHGRQLRHRRRLDQDHLTSRPSMA